MPETRDNPKFLNLLRISMPVGAVTSIAHRMSGVLLFLAAPYAIYLFAISLRDAEGFARVAETFSCLPMQLLLALVLWSLSHHFLAGIRFLLIDLEWGVERQASRRSAWAVNLAAPVLALLLLGALL